MTAPAPTRRNKALLVLALLGWTVAAIAAADRMLRYEWEFSCSTDSECEAEWDVKTAAERSID